MFLDIYWTDKKYRGRRPKVPKEIRKRRKKVKRPNGFKQSCAGLTLVIIGSLGMLAIMVWSWF